MAWSLGILASTWMLLPLAEYMQTGSRHAARSQGLEKRPPVGLEALPQVVLPDIYGSSCHGSYRIWRTSFRKVRRGATRACWPRSS